jgi:hypothetical protein
VVQEAVEGRLTDGGASARKGGSEGTWGGARPAGGGGLCAWLRCGTRKKTAGWAVRVSWASREAKAQWGEGGGGLKKKKKRMGRD